MDALVKPKLVFFQYEYDSHLPPFVLIHKREHVKCLSEFFDVTVVNHDCEYQQICDQYEPDLALFESGLPYLSSRRPNISKSHVYPQIPKIGLLHSDAFSEHRSGFLSDMDHWGIDTFFAIATTAAEHTPEIADQLFIWPNFVDADTYHDYGESKNIPVLFTGNQSALYPWRQAVSKKISKHYPTLQCPHGGYDPRSATAQLMVGESYARLLNASWCVPACGTAAKELVRKHFEVPACKSCLITDRSPALEAAGFVDMKNCVMVDDHNVLARMAYLFENRDEMRAISEAGYTLVQTRHTLKQRDQILQWLRLHQSLKPHQRIIQRKPFEPLCVVDKSQSVPNSHVISNGLFNMLLDQGDDKLWGGEYGQAELLYLRCLSYYRWMPEPQLRMALCCLRKGDAKMALEWIMRPIGFTLADYKAADPDPVEWAYFIICLLCLGRLSEAAKQSSEFEWLRHPELDRARWAANACHGHGGTRPSEHDEGAQRRASIHQLPSRSFNEWLEQLCIMLAACGRPKEAEALNKCASGRTAAVQAEGGLPARQHRPEEEDGIRQEGRPRNASGDRDGEYAHGLFARRRRYARAKETARRALRYLLHSLESSHGYFLPHHLSASKDDELFGALQEFSRQEDVKTIVIVGSTLSERSVQALVAGARENRSNPSLFCISRHARRFLDWRKSVSNYPIVKWYRLPPASSGQESGDELRGIVRMIRDESQVSCFDLVLIDGSELVRQGSVVQAAMEEMYGARIVVLEDVNRSCLRGEHGALLRDAKYVLIDQNLSLRDGYAVFEREMYADDGVRDARQSLSVLM